MATSVMCMMSGPTSGPIWLMDWSADGRALLFGGPGGLWKKEVRRSFPSGSPHFQKVVETCLAEDPEDRWQTAREVKLGLQWAGSGTAPSVQELSISPHISRRGAIAAASGALIVGIGGATALLWKPPAASSAFRFSLAPPEGAEFLNVNNRHGRDDNALHFETPRPLFPLPASYFNSYAYDVSPDGRKFLVISAFRSRPREPLTVVVNWPALLPK
jgi:hypothetical protein